jgi:hypothetical protein
MTTQDIETLAQLVSVSKHDSGLTYKQISERSIDPESGYRASANILWKIGTGEDVKINPPLVRAVAQGLGLSLKRVQAAAARQFLGWLVDDPFGADPGDDDEVVRVVHRAGLTAADLPRVAEVIKESRRRGDSG